MAQPVAGIVVDHEQTPLIGASLSWQGTNIGVTTNDQGYFKIDRIEATTMLVVSYVGFEPDTLEIEPQDTEILITLALGVELSEVEITAKQRDNFVSTIQTYNVETIGKGELKKVACCNLSESFETTGAVNVSYIDGVTGAKEIEMLGLRGVYSMMMVENRPAMRGLGYPFGMEYIPGTWVSNISIAKGASTVVNGYEGITGNLNVELVKPFEGEKLFLNGYTNIFGKAELNAHINHKINEKWSIGTLLHGNYRDTEIDHGEDGFLDMPRRENLNGLVRVFYQTEPLRAQFNVQALTDRLRGGQVGYDNDPTNLYGFDLLTDRVEFFGKIGYVGFKNPYESLGWITNAIWHRHDGFFGRKNYDATQRSLYTNLIYQNIFTTSDHSYKLGASYILDDYDEAFDNTDYSLKESVIGGFFEYNYTSPETPDHSRSIAITAGLRADYHNLYGLFVTPRLNIKFNFNEDMVIRLSGGRGYRTARILAENIGLLPSAKAINLTETLEAEEAWNAGVNFTRNGKLFNRDLSFSVDFYHTNFVNQIVVDRETEDAEILIYNLKGKSYSNSFLTTVIYDLFDVLELKLAYKFNDVKITYSGDLLQMPLVARHRGLVTLSYSNIKKTWKAHTALQFVGQQRMPIMRGHENHSSEGHNSLTDYQILGVTPTYTLVNAQVTRIFGKWEVYLGSENLTGYMQHHPIIGATDPFNEDTGIPTFDASQIYAPIMGAMVYGGFRVTF